MSSGDLRSLLADNAKKKLAAGMVQFPLALIFPHYKGDRAVKIEDQVGDRHRMAQVRADGQRVSAWSEITKRDIRPLDKLSFFNPPGGIK